MKTAAISRFVIVGAVLALMSAPLFAQISFPNFSSVSGLTLNGSAAQAGSVLRLTQNQQGQMGSAFFTTQQTVLGTFSTTFTFQLGGTSTYNADGFAFVIQNSAANALGPAGCGIGFGGNPNCTGSNGIPNSVAVEFDTFPNTDDPNGNHVSIQSCLTGPNSTDSGTCRIADNPNPMNGSGIPVTLADGNPHSVSVSFTPSGSCTNTTCPGVLDVTLDGNDLFPGAPAGEDTPAVPEGVPFDIAKIGLNSGNAWVGFTAATGGGDDNQDILSWTFSPKTQSIPLPAPGVPAISNFNGGINNNSFDQTATLDLNSPVTSATLNVKPILIDKNSCNKLVHQTFPLAQCFVFQNADGNNTKSAVLFQLNCTNVQGECSSTILATLGNDFVFQYSDNPGFNLFNSTIGAYVGVLKGESGAPDGSCQTDGGAYPLKFTSNQISKFTLTNDPVGGTTQKAHPGTSCWTIVWGATGELPPGITITAPAATTYPQGIAPNPTTLPASYACTNPATSKDPNGNSAVGPYLTVGSCTQSQAPNNLNTNTCNALNTGNFATSGLACTGQFDVSAAGLHLFVVTAKDSAGNVSAKPVVYNVKKH
jgi:Legume lectin domain